MNGLWCHTLCALPCSHCRNISPSFQTFSSPLFQLEHRGGVGVMPLDVLSMCRVRNLLLVVAQTHKRIDVRSAWKDCTLERSGCPEPVSMRVLLSVLYPVLSLTVFGFYPSMVSGIFFYFPSFFVSCHSFGITASSEYPRVWRWGAPSPVMACAGQSMRLSWWPCQTSFKKPRNLMLLCLHV